MLQIYSRVAQNQPLQPGDWESLESRDEENLNDAKGRAIKEQELTRERPRLDQENNNRSGLYKKFRICFCGLITICIFLFSSGAFSIYKTKNEYINLLNCSKGTSMKSYQKLDLKSFGAEDMGKENETKLGI